MSLSIKDGRVIAVFGESNEFAACRAAEAWCESQGISVGPSQADGPRGLLWGDFQIAKWRNLTPAERKACHGLMTGNMRHGPVTVTVKRKDAIS